MNHNKRIADELNLNPRQVESAVKLLQQGNTIPFIARYRKEMTFSLDELRLRQIEQKYNYFQSVDTRRDQIISAIEKQDKLDDKIRQKLNMVFSLVELEEIYQPFKGKRMTRASRAIDAGLQPLANTILNGNLKSLRSNAQRYVSDAYPTVDDVLAGARDIIAQEIADDSEIRHAIRTKAYEWGEFKSSRINTAEDEKEVFRLYYDFSNRVKWLKPYQVLAINRGEDEKILRVKVTIEDRDWLPIVRKKYLQTSNREAREEIELAIGDAGKRLLLPAVERETRRHLTEVAQEHAIDVFVNNLRGLLLQAPLSGVRVMGIDPAFRTGCKVAIINETGMVVDTCTIYPNLPQKQYAQSLGKLKSLAKTHAVDVVAIGNGTASRETELLVADLVADVDGLQYLIVNEAGASVYSASNVARSELPELDVTIRGAVSIARRVQDPLAELVKIDPKSIGIGLYQHDLNQTALSDALTWVVQTVVNQVGVDLNTSSVSLLKYVAGISDTIAQNIVEYRDKIGQFRSRFELRDVKGIGDKTFQQCSGFLRIRDGEQWMDSSAIHPESYEIASKVAEVVGISDNVPINARKQKIDIYLQDHSVADISDRFEVGEMTVEDILEQFVQPGRDPREDLVPLTLKSEILKMEDLREGMHVDGVVRNVVDFGAFVDIGVKQDGLLHSSKIPHNRTVEVGETPKLEIVSLDLERGRIGLALK